MRLPDPIGSVLERDEDERRLHRNWEGTRARMAARDRRPATRTISIGLAFAALALVVVLAWPKPAAGPLRTEGGALPVAAESVASPRTLRFDDGSSIELASGARVVPRANDERRFEWVLERGRTRVEVTPGGPRAWTIDAGIATVRVIGTAFVVEREDGTVRVEVERGRVRVEGDAVPNGRRELVAGERIEVHATEEHTSDDASESAARLDLRDLETAPDDDANHDATDDAIDVPASTTNEGPADTHDSDERPSIARWQALAERGDHRGAYEALSPSGLERRARGASARELLLLAAVARLSGHPADAVAPLRRFLDAHASHPEAPLAAITLARVELSLQRPAAAAEAFERAQSLGVPGAFDAEVCSGLALARARVGALDAARDAARRCLERHANAPQREALRRLAEEPEDDASASSSDGSEPNARPSSDEL